MEPGLVLSEMQEMHSIGGGRFFGASGGLGDRRLRPHQHTHGINGSRQNHQTLKCPRCDSLNTKFCYYNNYNLSQPRHFCKSCRRYWTKGGVLRNVPVGGGCRKSKRSKPKSSSSETSSTAAKPTAPPAPLSSQQERERRTSTSHSSSESSSLTAAAAAAATEAVSAPPSNSAANNLSDNLQDSNLFVHSNSKPSFEPGAGEDSGIFSEIENLTSLIPSSNETLAFGYGNITDVSSFQFCGHWQRGMNPSYGRLQDLKFSEITMTTAATTGWLLDQAVPVDLSTVQSKMGNGGLGPLDWQGSTDHQGLFDLPDTVDQALLSHNQWNEDNPSLFHLP